MISIDIPQVATIELHHAIFDINTPIRLCLYNEN